MPMIMNGGATSGRDDATEANALRIVDHLCADLKVPREECLRNQPADTNGGWFAFTLRGVDVHVPGDDPDEVLEGRPLKSRRLYVDGSSWWHGYALGIIESKIEEPR